jgi:hypothetical protein
VIHREPGATPPVDPGLEYIVAALTDSQHEPTGSPDDEGPVTQPITPHRFVRAPRPRPPLWVEILGVVIGVPWAGFFVWCLYVELATPPRHAEHATLFFVGFMIGALIAFGRWFLFPIFQNVIVLYADYKRGGRRWYEKGDQP